MPRILGESLDEHRSQVRRRVFDAFAQLLSERAYDAITLADIAATAGIGRTVIYNHFADKDAVVVAFAGEETERYLDRLAEVLAAVEDPVERLRTYIRHHRASADEFHLGLGAQLAVMASRASLAGIREHVEQVQAVLGGILADGIATGAFQIDDVPAALSLVNAAVQPRHVSTAAVEQFVLRGVGAVTRG